MGDMTDKVVVHDRYNVNHFVWDAIIPPDEWHVYFIECVLMINEVDVQDLSGMKPPCSSLKAGSNAACILPRMIRVSILLGMDNC